MSSCGLAVLAVSVAPASATPLLVRYDALEDGVASGAWGVNDSGVAVGWSNTGSTSHAVKWVPGQPPQDLGTLPGWRGSRANAINDSGVVVGRVTDSFAVGWASRWSAEGVVTVLATPAGTTDCEALAVNNDGVAVGECETVDPSRHSRAVRWAPDGTATVLTGLPGGAESRAAGINAAGEIVGWSSKNGDYVRNAVVWNTDGVATELTTPQGAYDSQANGINDRGQITGRIYVNSQDHAVRWQAGTAGVTLLATLPNAPASHSNGRSIASDGTIVGDTKDATGRYVAARWAPDGTVARLATLPGVSDGTIDFATAVNSHDVIVGSSGGNAVRWTGYR